MLAAAIFVANQLRFDRLLHAVFVEINICERDWIENAFSFRVAVAVDKRPAFWVERLVT